MIKTAIVTGANIGLGFETALVLAKEKHTVIMACRNIEKAEKAKRRILIDYPNTLIDIIKLDLGDFDSIRKFCKLFTDKYKTLNLLINNAGLMTNKYQLTKSGLESNAGINYFGHFLLSNLLLKTLENTPNSRIVSLSSIAHKQAKNLKNFPSSETEFKGFMSYAQSKLACLMFANELQIRLHKKKSSTISVCAHPGVSITNIAQNLPNFVIKVQDLIGSFFLSKAIDAAKPIILAATGKDVQGGEYYGPSGFREIKGKPVKVDSTKISKDHNISKKLWNLSEELTKEKFEV